MDLIARTASVVRVAARSLRRSPLFIVVVVASLGIGIGACTLAFSTIEAATFRQSVFTEPDRLVVLMETTSPDCPSCVDSFSASTFDYWARAGLRSFASLAPYEPISVELDGLALEEPVAAARVWDGFFSTLGVGPALGYVPDSTRCRTGRESVVLLSFGLWHRLFGARRDAIGMQLKVDGQGYTVTGVLPRGFSYPDGAKLWLACSGAWAGQSGDVRALIAVGRLHSNQSVGAARSEMAAVARRMEFDDPATHDGRGVIVQPLKGWSQDGIGSAHWVLIGAVGLAFLVVCANVANLQLVRALDRETEIAIRLALGARWHQVASQLVAESLLLAIAGGTVGIVAAAKFVGMFSAVAEQRLGLPVELQINTRVLASAVLLAVAAAVTFGMAPILHLRHADQAALLRASGSGLTHRRRHRRLRNVLVWAELVIVIALSSGAVLFTSSYLYSIRLDTGFDASNLLVARLSIDAPHDRDPQAVRHVADEILLRLHALPHATSAAVWSSYFLPLQYRGAALKEAPLTVEGYGEVLRDRAIPLLSVDGTPGTLRTLGIRLIEGRDFTPQENSGGAPVVIINQVAAAEYWPGQSPTGKRLKFGPATSMNPWLTVVGVAEATVLPHHQGVGMALANPGRLWPVLFRPLGHAPSWNLSVGVRAEGHPEQFLPPLRRAVTEVFGPGTRATYATMRKRMMEVWPIPVLQLRAVLLTVFSLVSVCMGLIGIHAIVVESVYRRTREIGIRVALGATRSSVIWLVTREALALSGAGILGGLALTFLLITLAGRAIFGVTGGWRTGLLFGISSTNPLLHAALCLVLAGVVLVSSLIPAWRALRIDPARSLRSD